MDHVAEGPKLGEQAHTRLNRDYDCRRMHLIRLPRMNI